MKTENTDLSVGTNDRIFVGQLARERSGKTALASELTYAEPAAGKSNGAF